ncbi:aquaporin, partial [Bacillus thuringiensis]|uniref:aquaporin n=1 Tax=Bacillus thuringiensis TaxID=1428 RepID=UPI0021B6241C
SSSPSLYTILFQITNPLINISPFIPQLIPTFLLILLPNGLVPATFLKKSKPQNSASLPITLAWLLAVTFPIYILHNITPPHFNPAVTIAFACIPVFPWTQLP